MPKPSRFHRILALVLAVVFLVMLSGCGVPSPTAESHPVANTPAAPTSQPAPATPRPTSTPAPTEVPTVAAADPPATAVAENIKIAPEKGAQAPNFQLTDIEGNEVSLGDLQGKVILLNFWTTW